MHKLIAITALSVAIVGPAAFGQEDVGTRTQREAREVTKGVYDSSVQISPRVGAFGFADGQGNYTSRIMEGLTINWDMSTLGDRTTPWLYGLETGFMFSHVGAPGSNFFGTDEPEGTAGTGGNTFLVPGHLVFGYKWDKAMLALNAGGQLLYRSFGPSMLIGRDGDTQTNTAEVLASLGFNSGWEVSNSLALSLRGDYIPVPRDDMYTLTLGATIPIG